MAVATRGYVTDPSAYPDKSQQWSEFFDQRRKAELKQLINAHPDIIDEHAANPLGYRRHPSPYLQRLHNYFRMQPTMGKYYIYSDGWGEYRIAEVGEFGAPPKFHDDVFTSEEAAMHGVFMKRVADLQAS